jgi:hypothetical protein
LEIEKERLTITGSLNLIPEQEKAGRETKWRGETRTASDCKFLCFCALLKPLGFHEGLLFT